MNAFVTINAKSSPMSIDPARTAVIVVDMQNDFGTESGMFARAGIDVAPIRKAIEPTKAVSTAARKAGVNVAYLKMEFQPGLSNARPPESPNCIKHQPLGVGERVTAPDGRQSRILGETHGARDSERTTAGAGRHHHLQASVQRFYGTDLDERLRRLRIEYLIFTGCTTSVCVESTMRDAMFRDYCCILLADCAAEPIGAGLPRSNHEASLLVLQTLFGWNPESAKFIGALEDQRIPSARWGSACTAFSFSRAGVGERNRARS